MAKGKSGRSNSDGLLKSLVDRIVRLEEEKKAIADDIKEVKAEAKSHGFDVKAITQMVREARMDESDRAAQREHEAVCELYRASLGMLDGTPLGDAARKRVDQPAKEPDEPGGADDETAATEEPADQPAEPEFPAEDLAEAKQRGRDDAKAGKKILSNPYLSDDPRRAKWDEGYCEQIGGDGMEIPPHLRRREKPKKDEKGAQQ